MQIEPLDQAVLLLNLSFRNAGAGMPKPLSNREWNRFAVWLKKAGLDPSALLDSDVDKHLEGWEDPKGKITRERLRRLLDRGTALAIACERWQRAGLWVLTRSNPDYPKRLKQRIGAAAPAVIFGCGNMRLLDEAGIAVVGSRRAGDEYLDFAQNLGAKAAEQGYSLISGGARGVDSHAMQGALEGKGTALGVLSDSLLRSAMSVGYRKYIQSDQLALISPFNPEASFHVGNAMARNAYTYCLADAAVVVCWEVGKGGTWSGAVAHLKQQGKRKVPVWVRQDGAAGSGSAGLVELGAVELPPDGPDQLSDLMKGQVRSPADDLYALFLTRMAGLDEPKRTNIKRMAKYFELELPQTKDWLDRALKEGDVEKQGRTYRVQQCSFRTNVDADFYEMFVERTSVIIADSPKRPMDIAERLQIRRHQAERWLRRAEKAGQMNRLARPPARYEAAQSPLPWS